MNETHLLATLFLTGASDTMSSISLLDVSCFMLSLPLLISPLFSVGFIFPVSINLLHNG